MDDQSGKATATKLVKVTHRFMQDNGNRMGLVAGGVRVMTNEVWINPDQIAIIVTEGDWYSIGLAGLSRNVTVDEKDLALLVGAP
jgi:hypothetical protein